MSDPLGKLVRALERIRPILETTVLRSPWIATDQKDAIMRHYDGALTAMADAYQRSTGRVPFTKSTVKAWEKRGREIETAGKN